MPAASKPVPGITRPGAASIHLRTLSGVPKTTAVTFSRSMSATTSLMYSPFAAGYSLGVHSSCAQPLVASLVAGSEAVNLDVFGHIGTAVGPESSIAWKWTSSTGGAAVDVFWAYDTAAGARQSAMQASRNVTMAKM